MSERTVEEFRAQFPQVPEPDAPAEAETAEETAVEEDAPVVEEGRQRDEQGRFVAAEEEETPLLAGKYKTPEELERAYVEAQSVIGRQSDEVKAARELKQEFETLREQLTSPAAPQYDPGSLEAFFEANPQQIPAVAQQAIDTGDGFLYQKALAAWGELDQVGAMDFHARAVSDAKIAELREEFKPALQGVQRINTTNEFAAAYEAAAKSHDDFSAVLGSITQETLNGFPPEVLGALQTGDQTSKERVLETLYRWAKAEQAGNLSETATAVARQEQENSRAARQEATVASTTGSQDREPKSGIDAYREQFQASDAFRKAAGLV